MGLICSQFHAQLLLFGCDVIEECVVIVRTIIGAEKGISSEPFILQAVFHKNVVDACQDIVDDEILIVGHLV